MGSLFESSEIIMNSKNKFLSKLYHFFFKFYQIYLQIVSSMYLKIIVQ